MKGQSSRLPIRQSVLGWLKQCLRQQDKPVARPDSRTSDLSESLEDRSTQTVTRTIRATHWCIIAPLHTLYIAHLLAEALEARGWHAEILNSTPQECHHDLYIVICAQVHPHLPPPNKRIVFQVEQSVATHWFTEAYLQTLSTSLAVLDYSTANIEFLKTQGLSNEQLHHLPIGTSHRYGAAVTASEKKYDVVFYGDMSAHRRKSMLDIVKQHFDLHAVCGVFGEEMIQTLKQARVALNIHYYDNAILETPRIQECLSLGVRIVSESSQDQDCYPELGDAVIFFEDGSTDDMIRAIDQALRDDRATHQDAARLSRERFDQMFETFLTSLGSVDCLGNHPAPPNRTV